jgi:hypothetical protein
VVRRRWGDLDRTLRADAEHAALPRRSGRRRSLPPLERAIRDELTCWEPRARAPRAARRRAIRSVSLGLVADADGRSSLAIELLEVTLDATRRRLPCPS